MQIILNYILPFLAILILFLLARTKSFSDFERKYNEVFTLIAGFFLGVLGLDAIHAESKQKIIFVALLGVCLLYVTLKKVKSKKDN